MQYKKITLPANKSIALVAHDNKKPDIIRWCEKHQSDLAHHKLYATGTTGTVINAATGLEIERLISGPLGGDQQVGSLITEGKVDFLIFFWDPFEPMPHDPDVKALLRIAAVWNVPVAMNRASADYLFTSPLLESGYERRMPDYGGYTSREV